MNRVNILIAVCLAVVAIATASAKQGSLNSDKPSSDGYKLVWADEFNKDGPPDPCNWTYERGFVRNEELQWYQPENARCQNGLLVIEGRREQSKPAVQPGRKKLEGKPRVCPVHVGECHDPRFAQVDVRPV